MINSNRAVGSLGNVELLAATREILRRGCVVEAELLVHLAEIEERRLHSEMASRRCSLSAWMSLGSPRTRPTIARPLLAPRDDSQRCSTRCALGPCILPG